MRKDKIKGFFSGIIVSTLVMGVSLTAFAAAGQSTITVGYDNIKVYIDQKLTTLKDPKGNTVEPFTYNDTTYVPLRAVSESLGRQVSWDGKTKSIYIGIQPSPQGSVTTPDAPAEKTEFKFTAGNYTAGTDFPAGKYNVIAVNGTGNVSSSNMFAGGLNEIMGGPGEDRTFYLYEYKNAEFPSGTTLRISGDVLIKIVKI